jgi:hypothetical protein
MMWIDIGVTVLLTLRIGLFRPALPQLVDLNDDAWLLEERSTGRVPLRCDGEVNEYSPRKSSSGRAFAITYSCNARFEGASVTSSCFRNIISHKVRFRVCRSGAPSIFEACGQ